MSKQLDPSEYPFEKQVPNVKYDQDGLVEISPETAVVWLDRVVTNRRPSAREILKHKKRILEGRWREWNPEPISFDWDGRLVDGEQRLRGIVAADQTVRARVITGLPPEAQDIINTGRPRRMPDILRMRGYTTDPNNLAALANRDYRYQTNQVKAVNDPADSQTLLRMVQENEERYLTAIQAASRVYGQFRGIPKSLLAHAWLLFVAVDESENKEDTTTFFYKLQTGLDLVKGDPIYALRSNVEKKKAKGVDENDVVLLAMLIKAWNYWRAGKHIDQLRFRAGGSDPEAWPVPK